MNKRDQIATAVMQSFMLKQGKPMMTLKSRILFFLGLNGWTRTYNYGFEDIAIKSYQLADEMLKHSIEETND